jgi:hypothetical protein
MNYCARCGRSFKSWTIRKLTAEGYGPTCARVLGLIPQPDRPRMFMFTLDKRSRRRALKEETQLELELEWIDK